MARKVKELARELRTNGSTALGRQDERIANIIQPISSPGFFVELGAYDGISQSNTYLLQRHHGWHGLLIEPDPRMYEKCIKNRRDGKAVYFRCCACVPFNFDKEFVKMESSGLMSVGYGLDTDDEGVLRHARLGEKYLHDKHERIVYGALALPLTDILDEHKIEVTIDLLSLDVEGNELSVLRGIDFSRHRPRFILIEIYPEGKCCEYLASQGYEQEAILYEHGNCKDILYKDAQCLKR